MRLWMAVSGELIMQSPLVFVTGACGLIGSEVCLYFSREGFRIAGLDNNQRAIFFGPEGDTSWTLEMLRESIPGYQHHAVDIRDRSAVLALVSQLKPGAIIHAAAQPSHDRAAAIPFDDFDTNAVGTLNLLEAARRHCRDSPFIHMSTNKVYGDAPNRIPLTELPTRWEYADPNFAHGIPESFTVDQSLHSLFGASKLAADGLVQEYGRYFDMPTCCLRGGCLTGPSHSGVELHGFLSYLIKCNVEGREYRVFGYKGKQVRDNIHSLDVARFIHAFIEAPRVAEVYNLGGGKGNSVSILEAFELVSQFTGKAQRFTYVEQARAGDHICYYSNLRKMRAHYPGWDITQSLDSTVKQMVEARTGRAAS